MEQRAGSPGLAQSQGEWHSGSQVLKAGALLDFFLLVRTPSTTVGTLPELGSTTWMWTGVPVEELLALHPELARWPWPQEVTCAQVWRSARERNQLCVPRKQQCLRGAAVGVPRCGNARSRELFFSSATLTGTQIHRESSCKGQMEAGKFIPFPTSISSHSWEVRVHLWADEKRARYKGVRLISDSMSQSLLRV